MKYGLQILIFTKEYPVPLAMKIAVSEELARVIDSVTITGARFITEQFIASVGVPGGLPIAGSYDITDGTEKIKEVNDGKKNKPG